MRAASAGETAVLEMRRWDGETKRENHSPTMRFLSRQATKQFIRTSARHDRMTLKLHASIYAPSFRSDLGGDPLGNLYA